MDIPLPGPEGGTPPLARVDWGDEMKLWLKSVKTAALYTLWFLWVMSGIFAVVLLEGWGVPILLFTFVTGMGTMIWSLEKQ